ncbi:MAG TPA: efflux RND transporter periplasmic adaptor subunit [Puia sp.]|jgi:membrane fusion protein (multidrug efflux system)|nr:efflux RND transporter periplasmic adaptor subunit [Puia sp.]
MKSTLSGAAGLSFVVISLLYGCKDGSATAGAGAMPPPQLPVITATAMPATTYQDFTASVEGKHDVEIRPQLDGYLTGIEVDEGAYVHKGQTLFIIDRRPFEEQLNNAKAALVAAKASVENAKINVDKLKPLVEGNVVSDVQLKSAQASYDNAKAAEDQAQAAVESARINLGYTTITAPSDGYVGLIPFKTGSLVTKAMSGYLTVVSETKDMRVYFSMSEPDFLAFKEKYPGKTVADKVKQMPPVELVLADNSVYPQKGKVELVEGQFDRTVGAIKFRASFPNAEGMLRSGSTGKVRIPTVYKSVLVVPQDATFELQGKVFVYTVADSNKIVTKPLSISGRTTNYYFVANGVKQGDKIVLSSMSTTLFGGLRDGMVITPQMISTDSLLKVKPI